MAKRPRSDQDDADPGQLTGVEAAQIETAAGPAQTPSAEAEEAILRLARLVGRQIARERLEREQTRLSRSRRNKEAP